MDAIFCSTIITTVGRASLSRAVESVLQQVLEGDRHELIIVNDSGRPLTEAAWLNDDRVQVLNTRRRERSFARNTGAAVALGRYFHFLDDDDWLAPDALHHFRERSQDCAAGWLYGSSQLVDENNRPIIQLHHGLQGNASLQFMAGEWIPLQASMIKADAFWKVGGFNQRITGPEDIDLLRRISLDEDVAEVPHLVAYIVRGQADTTTDYVNHPEMSRWARERILDTRDCFARMRMTAPSAYWHGRLVRIYLTSVWWNLRRSRLLKAGSRGAQTLASLFNAGKNVLQPPFWRSVAHAYESDTFRRGFAVARAQTDGVTEPG